MVLCQIAFSIHVRYVPGPRGWAIWYMARRPLPVKPKAGNQLFRGEGGTRQLPQESDKSLLGQGEGSWNRKSEGTEVRTKMKCHGCFSVNKVKGEKRKKK